MPEISDRDIIKLFKQPDKKEEAFRQLVSTYKERLYWHCRRLLVIHEDADDALQNTFIKAWNNLEKFRGDSELYTWLFRIATNESLTLLKAKKRYSINQSENEDDISVSQALISDPYFNGDEAEIKLQEAIHKLPNKQRVVFNLKYFEEMKYEHMAETLKTSVGALKASYHHAVKKIEQYLEEQ